MDLRHEERGVSGRRRRKGDERCDHGLQLRREKEMGTSDSCMSMRSPFAWHSSTLGALAPMMTQNVCCRMSNSLLVVRAGQERISRDSTSTITPL